MVIDIYDTVQQLQDPGTMPQWAGPFPCHQGTTQGISPANLAISPTNVRHTKITAIDTTKAEAIAHTHWQEQNQKQTEQVPAHQEWLATAFVIFLAAIMAYFIGRQFK